MRRSGSFAAFSAPGFATASSGASVLTMPMKSLVLKRVAVDQRRAADLLQRIFEFVQAIGGIDGDEDQPRLGGGELGQRPFRPVERPDADPLAALQAELRAKPAARSRTRAPKLAPGPGDAMARRDQRRTFRPALDGALQRLTDRLAEQRLVAGAADIAERALRHEILPPIRCLEWAERSAIHAGLSRRRVREIRPRRAACRG